MRSTSTQINCWTSSKINTRTARRSRSSKGGRWRWMGIRWIFPTKRKISILIYPRNRSIATVGARRLEKWWGVRIPIARESGSMQCVWMRRIYRRSGIAMTARSRRIRPKILILKVFLWIKSPVFPEWFHQIITFLHLLSSREICWVARSAGSCFPTRYRSLTFRWGASQNLELWNDGPCVWTSRDCLALSSPWRGPRCLHFCRNRKQPRYLRWMDSTQLWLHCFSSLIN